MIKERASGVLLHVTSLPSSYGIGDLGPQAYKFVDFLAAGAQKYWQVLPLNCTTAKTGHSPYNCLSAFAGNSLLISPELLYRRGLLTKSHLREVPAFSQTSVEYDRVAAWKKRLCETAFRRFQSMPRPSDYDRFSADNGSKTSPVLSPSGVTIGGVAGAIGPPQYAIVGKRHSKPTQKSCEVTFSGRFFCSTSSTDNGKTSRNIAMTQGLT